MIIFEPKRKDGFIVLSVQSCEACGGSHDDLKLNAGKAGTAWFLCPEEAKPITLIISL